MGGGSEWCRGPRGGAHGVTTASWQLEEHVNAFSSAPSQLHKPHVVKRCEATRDWPAGSTVAPASPTHTLCLDVSNRDFLRKRWADRCPSTLWNITPLTGANLPRCPFERTKFQTMNQRVELGMKGCLKWGFDHQGAATEGQVQLQRAKHRPRCWMMRLGVGGQTWHRAVCVQGTQTHLRAHQSMQPDNNFIWVCLKGRGPLLRLNSLLTGWSREGEQGGVHDVTH